MKDIPKKEVVLWACDLLEGLRLTMRKYGDIAGRVDALQTEVITLVEPIQSPRMGGLLKESLGSMDKPLSMKELPPALALDWLLKEVVDPTKPVQQTKMSPKRHIIRMLSAHHFLFARPLEGHHASAEVAFLERPLSESSPTCTMTKSPACSKHGQMHAL